MRYKVATHRKPLNYIISKVSKYLKTQCFGMDLMCGGILIAGDIVYVIHRYMWLVLNVFCRCVHFHRSGLHQLSDSHVTTEPFYSLKGRVMAMVFMGPPRLEEDSQRLGDGTPGWVVSGTNQKMKDNRDFKVPSSTGEAGPRSGETLDYQHLQTRDLARKECTAKGVATQTLIFLR